MRTSNEKAAATGIADGLNSEDHKAENNAHTSKTQASSGDEAVKFLEWLRPAGPWTLTAILPDGDGPPVTIAAHDAVAIRGFVDKHNRRRNIYYSVNPIRAGLEDRRAAKVNIAAIEYALADCDPREDETSEAAKARYREALKATGVPPPSAIVDSGNGLQILWRLAEPIALPEPLSSVGKDGKPVDVLSDVAKASIDNVEACSKAVMIRLGTKAGTQDISRILRLPGTANLPNAKKKREGRVECQARLLEFNDGEHALDSFPLGEGATKSKAKAKSTKRDDEDEPIDDKTDGVGDLKVSTRIKKIIRTGVDPDDPRLGRSECVMAVAVAFAAERYADEVFRRFLLDPTYPISAHVLEQTDAEGRYIDRIIERAREFIRKSEGDIEALMKATNEKFALVMEAGKATVFKKATADGRKQYLRITPADFRLMLNNQTVLVGSGSRAKPMGLGDYWIKSPQRRDFLGGVTFDPSGKAHDGVLNLWTGFAFEPKPGDWSKLKDHIRDIVCDGDGECYEYTMNWMARCVQHPEEIGEVCIVMQGEEGVGKGTLANAFGKVFGQHALHITHTKHLTGNFNAHLQDCVFLFADEAFFAGDREHSGVLRGLITERDHTIEDKYRRIVKSPNHVHMMMASNDDWIVPASLTDRRFCVLRTSSARKGDTEYFKAINDQLEAGGYEAMLDELLHRDLSGFDVRRIPNTAARDSQKLRSMKLHEKWWMEVLSRGYVFESKLGCEDFFSHWESTVAMELLYKSYLATPIGRAPRESREDIGKFLTKVGGKKVRPRSAYVGEHLESGPDGKGVAREPVLQTDPRPYCYDFGPLDLARAKFEAAIGVAINWGEDGEEIEPAPEDKQTLDDAIEFDDAQRRLRRDRRRSREDD